jgi:predicted RNase H-like HicB family nuclease
MLQADPLIQAPGNTQSYSRYSDVLDYPLHNRGPSLNFLFNYGYSGGLAILTRIIGLKRNRAMQFIITVDRDEDGAWITECPSIPGCVSQGQTKEEAIANIQEAIQLCLEVRAEKGLPLTIETRQLDIAV